MAADLAEAQLLQEVKSRDNVFVRFYKSKASEFYILKFGLGGIFGAGMGYGLYSIAISGVFLQNEHVIRWIAAAAIVGLMTLGCAASVQCRCVTALCVPAMVGATGRRVLYAVLATWILAGPVANMVHHGGEVVRSMTCIARLHVHQMTQLMHLLHTPVTSGFLHITEVAALLNDTEEALNVTINKMEMELWDRKSDNSDGLKQNGDVAEKLRSDTIKRCKDMFIHGVKECKRLFRKKEQECLNTIKIPIIKEILCFVLKSTFLCNAVNYFSFWCQEVPDADDADQVNSNYREVSRFGGTVKKEVEAEFKWKVPKKDQRTGVMTVDEIADSLENDFDTKKHIFDFAAAVIRKIVAVSFILVISNAASYNYKYLTDIRFDNVYITPYFRRKDRERKKQGKRYLLPLSRLEKRNLVYTLSLKLTSAEKKPMLFKVLKLAGQIIYTSLLLMIDYLIFYILDLIRRHGRIDAFYTGKHKLEVTVEGNGTVANLLKRLFRPYEDNEVVLDSFSSNLDCLPRTHLLPFTDILWIIFGYVALIIATWLDAYSLRMRHVIASIAYRRREKARIVMLYNDVLQRRKNQLYHVRMTIQKLARKHRLNQKHSLMEILRVKLPSLQRCFDLLGVGRLHCLICEKKETVDEELIVCLNPKCRIRYCSMCWDEIGAKCWACEHSVNRNNELHDDETNEPSDDDTDPQAPSQMNRRQTHSSTLTKPEEKNIHQPTDNDEQHPASSDQREVGETERQHPGQSSMDDWDQSEPGDEFSDLHQANQLPQRSQTDLGSSDRKRRVEQRSQRRGLQPDRRKNPMRSKPRSDGAFSSTRQDTTQQPEVSQGPLMPDKQYDVSFV